MYDAETTGARIVAVLTRLDALDARSNTLVLPAGEPRTIPQRPLLLCEACRGIGLLGRTDIHYEPRWAWLPWWLRILPPLTVRDYTLTYCPRCGGSGRAGWRWVLRGGGE